MEGKSGKENAKVGINDKGKGKERNKEGLNIKEKGKKDVNVEKWKESEKEIRDIGKMKEC